MTEQHKQEQPKLLRAGYFNREAFRQKGICCSSCRRVSPDDADENAFRNDPTPTENLWVSFELPQFVRKVQIGAVHFGAAVLIVCVVI